MPYMYAELDDEITANEIHGEITSSNETSHNQGNKPSDEMSPFTSPANSDSSFDFSQSGSTLLALPLLISP